MKITSLPENKGSLKKVVITPCTGARQFSQLTLVSSYLEGILILIPLPVRLF